MKYLFVVDVQKEFVKDEIGQRIYKNCLRYIASAKSRGYERVIAAVYKNATNFANMDRLVEWQEMMNIKGIEFAADEMLFHSGYSIKDYPRFMKQDKVDVIGFDTDACVLATCFDLFNIGCNLRILINGCWSSGGAEMHEAGLKVMRRQFNKAVDETTRV